MAETIELSAAAAEARGRIGLVEDDAAVCVARGFSYAVALEAALKLKETSAIWAEGFSSADLRHGPTAAVTSATPALVFHAGGALEADVEQLEGELGTRGAALVSIGPGAPAADGHAAVRGARAVHARDAGAAPRRAARDACAGAIPTTRSGCTR